MRINCVNGKLLALIYHSISMIENVYHISPSLLFSEILFAWLFVFMFHLVHAL